MLFGMLKEKEVIDNKNFDTTKGDIVEDFGGVMNNQLKDNDLIPLTSFNESHSEDINYQNIDLNNPQTIINTINNPNNNQNIMNGGVGVPQMQNMMEPYQNLQSQNNYNGNYQNAVPNNQMPVNYNYGPQQSYGNYPNMNVTNVQPQSNYNVNYQNSLPNNQIPSPVQFGTQNSQQLQTNNVPINQSIPSPVLLPNKPIENSQVQVIPTEPIVQPITNIENALTHNINTDNIEQSTNKIQINSNIEPNDDIPNSPVAILTEVPEKNGRSSLTSALLSSPSPQSQNVQSDINLTDKTVMDNPNNIEPQIIDAQETNIDIVDNEQLEATNEIIKPIESEIKNISSIENVESIVEQPLIEDINNSQSLIENTKDKDTNNFEKEKQRLVEDNENLQQEESLLENNNNTIKNDKFEIQKETISNESQTSLSITENNANNVNDSDNKIELQPINDINKSQISMETSKNNDANNFEKEKQTLVESDNIEQEHKFIISDDIDVEPGFKICPKCGQKIRNDYRLCFVCGTYF